MGEFHGAEQQLATSLGLRDDLQRQYSEAVAELQRAGADRAILVDKVSCGTTVPDAEMRKVEDKASTAQQRVALIAEARRRADEDVTEKQNNLAVLEKTLRGLDLMGDKQARITAAERVDAAARAYVEAIDAWLIAGGKVIASLPPQETQMFIAPLADIRPAVAILPMPIQQAIQQNAFRLLSSVAAQDRGLWPRLDLEALDLDHRRALLVNSGAPDGPLPDTIVT